ncbi:hypothetical protein, partial [Bifidobacterium adolescentis]|uniref:hypothetical protein n=1 Tax=Bifidobacterium adolescentis TaxID=1680 RepID=UPI003BB752EB
LAGLSCFFVWSCGGFCLGFLLFGAGVLIVFVLVVLSVVVFLCGLSFWLSCGCLFVACLSFAGGFCLLCCCVFLLVCLAFLSGLVVVSVWGFFFLVLVS